MKRAGLIHLLKEYHPAYEEEVLYKELILSFVNENENCFERSLEQGHITASSWLLNASGDKALLMHHAKLGFWCQLGGHVDGNPDVLSSALREAQEESGIGSIIPIMSRIFDIDVHEIPQTSKEKAHRHYDIRFLLRVIGDEEPVPNSESRGLTWVGKNPIELPTKERSILRMHEKWVQQGFF